MTVKDNDEFLPPDLEHLSVEVTEHAQHVDGDVSQALAAHHDNLMGRAGVVMLGETVDATGSPAIVIGVRAHKNMSRLPREIDGVPVVVQVVGDVEIQ